MTPIVSLAKVHFKREDQNPTGSAKDRAIPLQIENLKKNGFTSAVISSTGNAAISAIYYCQLQNIPLTIFVSPQISPSKLDLLKKSGFNIITSNRAITESVRFAKSNHSYLLRQSTDPVAQTGYRQIGEEIMGQIPNVSSIFIPVGSGTTLLGLSLAIPNSVPIFAVEPENKSDCLTDALTVKFRPLLPQIESTIRAHQGQFIQISKSENQSGIDILDQNQIETSAEGALAYAGYLKTQPLAGSDPLILLTGAKR
jgi:threonine dehydratase